MSGCQLTFRFCISNGIAFLCSFILSVTSQSTDWNYLVFAQRWPPSACLDIVYGKCSVPQDVTEWIIHGLWPTRMKGYPSFCNQSWTFDFDAVKPVVAELYLKWPNIMSGSSDVAFWKHEWTKHGTCAASDDTLGGITKYFNKTLELHDEYNIFKILQNSSIIPGDDKIYSLKEVENALYMQLNKTVKIFCKKHKNHDYPLLDTIYVCLSKQMDLLDCDIPNEPSCNCTSLLYLPLNNTGYICEKL